MMAKSETAVTLLLIHWSYCSISLNRRYVALFIYKMQLLFSSSASSLGILPDHFVIYIGLSHPVIHDNKMIHSL